jgi:hypothetical protein
MVELFPTNNKVGVKLPIGDKLPTSSSTMAPGSGPTTPEHAGRTPQQYGLLRRSTTSLFRADTYLEVGSILNLGRAKVLLVLVPIGIAAGAWGLSPSSVFVLNLLALTPLAPLVTFSVVSLTKDAGPLGGLVRTILGNATELIVGLDSVSPLGPVVEMVSLTLLSACVKMAITALIHGQSQLVLWMLIGSTLAYSLFVRLTRPINMFDTNLPRLSGLRRCLLLRELPQA